jgi:O-methyltransferase
MNSTTLLEETPLNTFVKKTLSPLYHKVSDIETIRERADRIACGSRYRRWCQANPCPEFPDRIALYKSVVESEGLGEAIDYLEFGVYRGESIRWWVEQNHHPASRFHGFDTFEGLPENWDGMPAGAFSTQGQVPDIRDDRCHFVKGLFQDTFPSWLKAREFSNKLVVNMDADLYGGTLLVLVQLLPWLKPGSVLFFDEFHSYMHEFRGFQDALAAYWREFQVLGRSDGWSQVALRAC